MRDVRGSRRGFKKKNKTLPNLAISPGQNNISCTARPSVNVLRDADEDSCRSRIHMVKNHGISRLLQMPENQENNIDPNGFGKGSRHPDVPRPSHDFALHEDAEPRPKVLCLAAFRENVFICFKNAKAVGTPRFLQGSNVPLVEMGASVEPAAVQKPRKKI